MSALIKERRVAPDFNVVYDLTEKPNNTNLKPLEERALITGIKADLLLPTNKIMTVEIDFDSDSDYHNNAMIVMNDFGVELLATALEVKYGKAKAEQVRKTWAEKEDIDDPRKPSYILIQSPRAAGDEPDHQGVCGKVDHDKKKAPK